MYFKLNVHLTGFKFSNLDVLVKYAINKSNVCDLK